MKRIIVILCSLIFVCSCSKIKIEDKTFMGLYPGMNKEQVYSQLNKINNSVKVKELEVFKHYTKLCRVIGLDFSRDTLSFIGTYVYKIGDNFRKEPYFCHLGFIDNILYTIIIETKNPKELFNLISKGTNRWPHQHRYTNEDYYFMGGGTLDEITGKNCKILFANLTFEDYNDSFSGKIKKDQNRIDQERREITIRLKELLGEDYDSFSVREFLKMLVYASDNQIQYRGTTTRIEKDYIIFVSKDIQEKFDAEVKAIEDQIQHEKDSIERIKKDEYDNQIF